MKTKTFQILAILSLFALFVSAPYAQYSQKGKFFKLKEGNENHYILKIKDTTVVPTVTEVSYIEKPLVQETRAIYNVLKEIKDLGGDNFIYVFTDAGDYIDSILVEATTNTDLPRKGYIYGAMDSTLWTVDPGRYSDLTVGVSDNGACRVYPRGKTSALSAYAKFVGCHDDTTLANEAVSDYLFYIITFDYPSALPSLGWELVNKLSSPAAPYEPVYGPLAWEAVKYVPAPPEE